MKKSILDKHPIALAHDSYAAYAEENDGFWYLVQARVDKINREELLVLHFYSREDLMLVSERPILRVFLTHEDYISQQIKDKKWCVGRIAHLIECAGCFGWRWHGADRCRVADQASADAITAFLGASDNPLEKVDEHQNTVLAKRLDKRHAATLKRIDDAMAPVRDVPADFEQWIRNDALYDSRYIYYKYSKRKEMDGYCTHCRNDLKVTEARHNSMGTCPACGSVIRYKAEKKSRLVNDYVNAALMQPYEDGLVIRYFGASFDYRENYRKPRFYYGEVARAILKADGNSKWYEWTVFKQRGACRWCDDEGKTTLRHQALYTANLEALLHDTKYRYSAIERFAAVPGNKFYVFQYLTQYLKHMALEYLVKLGFISLVKQLTDGSTPSCIDLKGKTPQEILKLSTAGIHRAKVMNANIDEIRTIQKCEKLKVHLEDDQIRSIAKNLHYDALERLLKYTSVSKGIRYLNEQLGRYIKEQNTRRGANWEMCDIFNDWMDFLANATKLKYDLKNDFVLFPRDLKRAHDNAALLVKEKDAKKHAKAFEKLVPELIEKYSWQYGPYMIHVPKSADEVIKEGHTLHHCVGTYLESIANGSTVVLMLRRKDNPAEPFYTVEVRNGEVWQCRGKCNASMDSKIKKVMDRFKQEKLAPMRAAM